MRIGIGQVVCLAGGVFLLSLGGGFIGGRLAVQRHATPTPETLEDTASGNLPTPPPLQPTQIVPAEDDASTVQTIPEPEKPALKQLPESVRSNYAVQVLSTQNLDDARVAEKKIKVRGLPALVFEADLGSKGKWYRVYVGPYRSEAKAEMVLGDIRKIPGFQKSFVKFLEPGKDFVGPGGRKESGK
jgi:cell division septation protein DedD